MTIIIQEQRDETRRETRNKDIEGNSSLKYMGCKLCSDQSVAELCHCLCWPEILDPTASLENPSIFLFFLFFFFSFFFFDLKKETI